MATNDLKRAFMTRSTTRARAQNLSDRIEIIATLRHCSCNIGFGYGVTHADIHLSANGNEKRLRLQDPSNF